MSASRRLDRRLLELGLFETRAKAQEAIAVGAVTVNGEPARKASQSVPVDAVIKAQPAHPYVSRSALKLIGALDAFSMNPAGAICLDVGASTGGFVEVLLERGAMRVFAVDVGRGQLHERLRSDARVVSLEATDARNLDRAVITDPVTLITCDASFISLDKVLPAALALGEPEARLIALFKPQFEVGRAFIGKGGVVSDAAAIERAMKNARAFIEDAGFKVQGVVESPIRGGDGNQEYLIAALKMVPPA
ncbi:MAG: TlyA family RNA methyltransferase [Pseudomonadota bacterium]